MNSFIHPFYGSNLDYCNSLQLSADRPAYNTCFRSCPDLAVTIGENDSSSCHYQLKKSISTAVNLINDTTDQAAIIETFCGLYIRTTPSTVESKSTTTFSASNQSIPSTCDNTTSVSKSESEEEEEEDFDTIFSTLTNVNIDGFDDTTTTTRDIRTNITTHELIDQQHKNDILVLFGAVSRMEAVQIVNYADVRPSVVPYNYNTPTLSGAVFNSKCTTSISIISSSISRVPFYKRIAARIFKRAPVWK